MIDEEDVLLELWNGTLRALARVRDGRKLADLLERIAYARKREVTRIVNKS